MSVKKIIPCMYLFSGQAVAGFKEQNVFECKDVGELTRFYNDNCADEILVFDLSKGDAQHEEAISKIKEITDISEVPVIAAGNIRRVEDVKKLLYAGCAKVVLNFSKASNIALLEELSKRFGREKMAVCITAADEFTAQQEMIERYACQIICLKEIEREVAAVTSLPLLLHSTRNTEAEIIAQLQQAAVGGISGNYVSALDTGLMKLKNSCKQAGISVTTFTGNISWDQFKLNSDGMIPVIVQDYQTDEVLMLAYMNELAFQTTLDTGKMTYWSRSRDELWTKGLTSGHFQYVKALLLDCDNDTLLAKVSQIGAACHTGKTSCFFQEVVKKDYKDANPLNVFQNVFKVIQNRQEHPKEGSYTNYLFEKGLDKILKKIGEECTEIVIAAKNPDKEEIKYEISDFLYHIMVLMVEKGISWDDITKELSHRS